MIKTKIFLIVASVCVLGASAYIANAPAPPVQLPPPPQLPPSENLKWMTRLLQYARAYTYPMSLHKPLFIVKCANYNIYDVKNYTKSLTIEDQFGFFDEGVFRNLLQAIVSGILLLDCDTGLNFLGVQEWTHFWYLELHPSFEKLPTNYQVDVLTRKLFLRDPEPNIAVFTTDVRNDIALNKRLYLNREPIRIINSEEWPLEVQSSTFKLSSPRSFSKLFVGGVLK